MPSTGNCSAQSFPKHWEERTYLLSWVDPGEIPIHMQEGERVVGSGLLVVPLAFERPEPGTQVTVPRSFIPVSRLVLERSRPANLEGTIGTSTELLFHLPPSVLPLTIERVHLSAKIRGPGWKITLSGLTDTGPVTLLEADNPNDTFDIDITDPRFLRVHAGGDLRLASRSRSSLQAPRRSRRAVPRRGSQGRIGMGRKARAAERAVRNRRNPDWAKREARRGTG